MKVYIIHDGKKKYLKDYHFSRDGYAYAHYTPKSNEVINITREDAKILSKVFGCFIEE